MSKVNIQDIEENKELKSLILLQSIYKDKLNWVEQQIKYLRGD